MVIRRSVIGRGFVYAMERRLALKFDKKSKSRRIIR